MLTTRSARLIPDSASRLPASKADDCSAALRQLGADSRFSPRTTALRQQLSCEAVQGFSPLQTNVHTRTEAGLRPLGDFMSWRLAACGRLEHDCLYKPISILLQAAGSRAGRLGHPTLGTTRGPGRKVRLPKIRTCSKARIGMLSQR